MKAFNGFDEAKKAAQYSGGAQLPAGAYVCKILNVKFENGTNGSSDMIAIQFDIAEGEQKDFFKNQYDIYCVTAVFRTSLANPSGFE